MGLQHRIVVVALLAFGRPWAAPHVELRIHTGHSLGVSAVAISKDGLYVATGGGDKTARLWEVASGREIRRFAGHQTEIHSVSFSPDGAYLLTAGDETIRLWDTLTGRELRKMGGSPAAKHVTATVASFSADGNTAVSGDGDGVVHLWNLHTGIEIRDFQAQPNKWIISAEISRDGSTVLASSSDGIARLWETQTGRQLQLFGKQTPNAASDDSDWGHRTVATFTPDGRRVITGGDDNAITIWDVETGNQLNRLRSLGPIRSLVLSPNGRSIAAVEDESLTTRIEGSTTRVWDLESGREIRRLEGPVGGVRPIAFSNDSRKLLTGSLGDNTARLWEIVSGAQTQVFESRVASPADAEISADRLSIFFGSGDSTAIWDLAVGRVVRQFPGVLCSVSPDGRRAMTRNSDGELVLYDAATGQVLNRVKDRLCGFLSRDGRSVLSGPPAERATFSWVKPTFATLWDIETGMEVRKFDLETWQMSSAAFSRDGKQVAIGRNDGVVGLWTSDGYLEWVFNGKDPATGKPVGLIRAVFSPDDQAVLLASSDGIARVLDVHDGRVLHEFRGPRGETTAAYSSDGKRVMTANWDGIARIWDIATGGEVRLEGHRGPVGWAAFLEDDRYAATASDDGTIRIWDSKTGRPVVTLVSFRNGGWAVVEESTGRFDSDSLDGQAPLYWVTDKQPMHPLPLEVFMRQYYTPRLLARLLAGEKLPELPDIASLNYVQPSVGKPVIQSDAGGADTVTVRVKVESRMENGLDSGVRDLRLFLDGRLVPEAHVRDGNEYIFEHVRLPARKSVTFAAYAFNTELVKSETAETTFVRDPEPASRPAQSFLLNIGVNRNRASRCDLSYAARDAMTLSDLLKTRLPSPQSTLLTSDGQSLDPVFRSASKESIRAALERIALQATPDDLVLVSFSGHGYSDLAGRFYLFPSDLHGSCEQIDEKLLASAISADELAAWLRPIGAGEIVLILDACQSAASVQSGNYTPGPWDSPGLGQLAYDKRIRILAASQSNEAAGETAALKMGFLTYALTEDGLRAARADWQPPDGHINLREWLSYAVKRVPEEYEDVRNSKLDLLGEPARGVVRNSESKKRPPQVPVLFDFLPRDDNGIQVDIAPVPAASRSWIERGLDAVRNREFVLAKQCFQKAVEEDPRSTKALLLLAGAHSVQYIPGANTQENVDNKRAAESDFQRVLALDPENVTALESLALLALETAAFIEDADEKSRELDRARDLYRKAAGTDPHHRNAFFGMGVVDWTQAYGQYMAGRSRAGLEPESPGPIRNSAIRSNLRQRVGPLLDDAVHNLKRALEIDPEFVDALAFLNLCIRERADFVVAPIEYARAIKEADSVFERAVKLRTANAAVQQVPPIETFWLYTPALPPPPTSRPRLRVPLKIPRQVP